MRNYALIEKWKTQHEGVMYYFTKCLFFVGCTTILGACTDVKGFTNMDLGPYAKAPEVLKAFPTAEGFGKNATGGRNGVVVKVTNTNDDGEGSFRWALKQCSENEATTIVFTVSGKIELKSEIRCKAKNFTIAGQTAPGGGICVIKNEVNFGGSENFIIRHVRFRVGDKDASGKDHNAACLRVENANNFIIDHCSFSWASEENTDFIDTHFSTVQWCISSEGLYYSVNKKGSRGYGGAWGGTSSTYHHNLFAHCNSRTPLMNGARGKDPGQDINVYMEYINNVNYNWGSQMATYGGMDESQDSVPRKIDVVGTTLDDAAGECFDKVARLLGFPYPGGPHIDRHGQNGDPHAIKVPMGLTQGKAGAAHPYDFSFSGVKTAVARWVESEQAAGHEIPVDDVCASLADSVATVLARKSMRGCRQYDSNTLIVGGGFSANSQLRAKLLEFGENYGVDVRIPQIKLCTDNGAMVAMLGVNLVEAGVAPSAPDFPIDSAMPLTKVSM